MIGSYPLARRPRSVLANVVRDAEYLTCVRPQRLHDVSHRVALLDEHVPEVGLRGGRSEHAADELHDLVLGVGGRRGLVEGDLALLHALAAGQSVSAIAQALGCTDRTVRNRRQRLVTKLQELSVGGRLSGGRRASAAAASRRHSGGGSESGQGRPMPTTRSQLTPATRTTSPGCVAWTIWPLPMYIATWPIGL